MKTIQKQPLTIIYKSQFNFLKLQCEKNKKKGEQKGRKVKEEGGNGKTKNKLFLAGNNEKPLRSARGEKGKSMM